MRIALNAYFLLGDNYDSLSDFFNNKKIEVSREQWISSLINQRIYPSMDSKRKDKDALTPLSDLTCGNLLFNTLKHETENFTYSGHAFINTDKLNLSKEDEDKLMEYYMLTNSGYCCDIYAALGFDEDGTYSDDYFYDDEEVAKLIRSYSFIVSLAPEARKNEVKRKLKEIQDINMR